MADEVTPPAAPPAPADPNIPLSAEKIAGYQSRLADGMKALREGAPPPAAPPASAAAPAVPVEEPPAVPAGEEPTEPGAPGGEEPPAEDDAVASLRAEIAELRSAIGGDARVLELERRLAEQEERQATQDDARMEARISALRGVKEQAIDAGDLRAYDEAAEQQKTLELELRERKWKREHAVQARPDPQANARARELAFVREHRVTREEYDAMIGAEQFLAAKDRAASGGKPGRFERLPFAERAREVLDFVRGKPAAPPAAPKKPAPPARPNALPAGQSGGGSAAPTNIPAELHTAMTKAFGPNYDRARALKIHQSNVARTGGKP